jgi:hypothetical protein
MSTETKLRDFDFSDDDEDDDEDFVPSQDEDTDDDDEYEDTDEEENNDPIVPRSVVKHPVRQRSVVKKIGPAQVAGVMQAMLLFVTKQLSIESTTIVGIALSVIQKFPQDFQKFAAVPRKQWAGIVNSIIHHTPKMKNQLRRYVRAGGPFKTKDAQQSTDDLATVQITLLDALAINLPQQPVNAKIMRGYYDSLTKSGAFTKEAKAAKVNVKLQMSPHTALSMLRSLRLMPLGYKQVAGTSIAGLAEVGYKQGYDKAIIAANMLWLRDVAQISKLVLFEPRHFKLENAAWKKACKCNKFQGDDASVCNVIFQLCARITKNGITDFTVPTVANLVAFGKEIHQANRQRVSMGCHCTASLGRTGLMMMFVVMVSKQIFDPVKLMIATAKLYKREAVDEILELVQDKNAPHNLTEIMATFLLAYEELLNTLQGSRASLITTKTLVEFEKQQKKIMTKLEKQTPSFTKTEEHRIEKVLHKLPTDENFLQRQ